MQPEIVVLGYEVKASVEGRKGFQPISQKYASRDAANVYKDLCVKQGFKDAFVHEVTGFEKHKGDAVKKKKEIRPA